MDTQSAGWTKRDTRRVKPLNPHGTRLGGFLRFWPAHRLQVERLQVERLQVERLQVERLHCASLASPSAAQTLEFRL